MKRTAGTIDRACDLVRSGLTLGLDVSVAVTAPVKGGRPSYVVTVDNGPDDEAQAGIPPLEIRAGAGE